MLDQARDLGQLLAGAAGALEKTVQFGDDTALFGERC